MKQPIVGENYKVRGMTREVIGLRKLDPASTVVIVTYLEYCYFKLPPGMSVETHELSLEEWSGGNPVWAGGEE